MNGTIALNDASRHEPSETVLSKPLPKDHGRTHSHPFLPESARQMTTPPEEYEPPNTTFSPHTRSPSGSPHRRSVQFTRDASNNRIRTPVHSRNPSLDAAHPDAINLPSSRAKLKTKMRAMGLPLKPPAHTRTRSGPSWIDSTLDGYMTTSEADDDDADAESNAGDAPMPSRARKRPQPMRALSHTAPSTPIGSGFLQNSSPASLSPSRRTRMPMRRATTNDASETKGGYSEDEGRSRYSRATWKRRGSAWLTQQAPSGRKRSGQETSERTRPNHVRRLTQLAGSSAANDASPAGWRLRREPFIRLKNNLKAMAQRKRAERAVDLAKSAELISGMLAGGPAALILASNFQRDEHNRKKIPVLLEQLKLRIVEAKRPREPSDRHQSFVIQLEYGNGSLRMKWEVIRSLVDFVNLHANFKVHSSTLLTRHHGGSALKVKLPRFPRSAFPVMRSVRGFPDDDDEEDEAIAEEGQEGPKILKASGRNKTGQSSRRASQTEAQTPVVGPETPRSTSIGFLTQEGPTNWTAAAKKEAFAEKQRKKLEAYLRELVRFVMFRPGSNRLCKFLEISTLGINLAAEGGYHGKEGLMSLTPRTRRDIKGNLQQKWFVVRQNYIACVDTPENMTLSDVFLVDPDFRIQARRPRIRDQKNTKAIAKTAKSSATHPKHHMIRLFNSERRLTLFALNDRQQDQFADSIKKMQESTLWSQPHRFESFAPERRNVRAEWLVDGRDYMWRVSRAIEHAKSVIYIHDWWLSPELYMRRPPAVSGRWRLDRLLRRKAQEGVRIFVIMYKNIDSAIPIDSQHSKEVLLDLHPNICAMRSPNNFKQTTLFWAHHEKICVIDSVTAFCGGVDLCFGRWDTPEHRCVDDKAIESTSPDSPSTREQCRIWPGKDYSNARVHDFFQLDDPFGEMYDRKKVPRMPWHDIGMQIFGQPARDLARHFVQRWNYLLRCRNATRPLPILLPPPDFCTEDVKNMDLSGTCDVQVLRSACDWSLGTPGKTEHSIMNAYMKLIERSEHLIYIENQFFISSCQVDATRIQNGIADAIVERIIRARNNDEDWLAYILIPLMPGFANPVNEQNGSSVRLIMQCQYRSICRGTRSIFSRLKAVGIQPEDYIRFYSLRSWGKIGHTKALTTEQLYIHAKCMIVDDRQVIIGSANINERSQLGSRDSEVAAVVFDHDMIDSFMAGEPYKVGRFPHSLRLRLMREHLGLDVDAIRQAEFEHADLRKTELGLHGPPDNSQSSGDFTEVGREKGASNGSVNPAALRDLSDMDGSSEQKENRSPKLTQPLNGSHEKIVSPADLPWQASGSPPPTETDDNSQGSRQMVNGNSPSKQSNESASLHRTSSPLPPQALQRVNTQEAGLPLRSNLPTLPPSDDTDIGGPPLRQSISGKYNEVLHPFVSGMRQPSIDQECMKDPLSDAFSEDIWHAVAENNTKLFRLVFRCHPDDEVRNWDDYETYVDYRRRFDESMGIATTQQTEEASRVRPPGPDAEQGTTQGDLPSGAKHRRWLHLNKGNLTKAASPKDDRSGSNESSSPSGKNADVHAIKEEKQGSETVDEKKSVADESLNRTESRTQQPHRRRRRATTRSSVPIRATDPVLNRATAEELLDKVQGHLVTFPYLWLDQVENNSQWLYPFDQVSPLEIYD